MRTPANTEHSCLDHICIKNNCNRNTHIMSGVKQTDIKHQYYNTIVISINSTINPKDSFKNYQLQ